MRVAWLIPEYPTQAHTFLRRELDALLRRNVHARVFSTRRPRSVTAHPWAGAAAKNTTYLHPPGLSGVAIALGTLGRAGPLGWLRCARAMWQADLPSARDRLRHAGLAFFGAELAGRMRNDGLRHVHVQFCGDGAQVAHFASLLSGVTYSISHHGALSEFGPNQRQKWQGALFGHTISHFHLTELRQELGDAVPADVVVAPMGIEPERFARRQPYQPWSGVGTFHIFSCGRLSPGKNQEALILALAALRKNGVDATLTLAGDDASSTQYYGKKLKAAIAEAKIESYVRLIGSVSEDRVRSELENAHVFALPSFSEGVSVAVMEAMAMEVPVIVTRVGGMPDLVADGKNGLIVAAGDQQALTEALARIARSPSLARELGAAARGRVVVEFHSGVSAEALLTSFRAHVFGAPATVAERLRNTRARGAPNGTIKVG